MTHWLKQFAAVSALAFLAACGGGSDDPVDIVATAQKDPKLTILAEAVVAADLASTLSGPGPYTVFAPTDEAFAALLTELGLTKAQLLADKALLTSVLTYHVVPANVPKSAVPLGKAITTVQGGIFKVDAVGSGLVVTDGRNRTANIIATDIAATNGVIHGIDKVLLPANKNIVETAAGLADFSILVEAVTAANLGATLERARPLHGVRADQRGVRGPARRTRRDQGRAAREHRAAHRRADLSRGRRAACSRRTFRSARRSRPCRATPSV